MHVVHLPAIGAVAEWRARARGFLLDGIRPEEIDWSGGGNLFGALESPKKVPQAGASYSVGKTALSTIETALSHSDVDRYARAYQVLWRMAHERLRFGDRSDPQMRKLLDQATAVRRDIHKMHAFVRFREGPGHGNRRAFAAWFEPEHPIVEAATPFFAKRFGDMDWVIATPILTATFTNGALSFAETSDTTPPPEDATEDLWCTYYASIFNPARLMTQAMQSEMPKKYWKNLPEARLIPDLVHGARARSRAMQEAAPTQPPAFFEAIARAEERVADAPIEGGLAGLKAQAARCARCQLACHATQLVWGEGPEDAPLMVVGEQPGDQEDLQGRPFVGPAGRLLREVTQNAGLDLRQAYVTNAVKHFKFRPRGRLRIHQRPNTGEVVACKWWLDLELRHVKPRLTLALGATAARALTGDGGAIRERRGRIETGHHGGDVLITMHPSCLLRLPAEDKARAMQAFVEDISRAAAHVEAHWADQDGR